MVKDINPGTDSSHPLILLNTIITYIFVQMTELTVSNFGKQMVRQMVQPW